ncbi:MAG: hypothetical protein ABR501_03025 [Pyrinomonadaceae bacterium]
MQHLTETWGTEPEERSLDFPCDRVLKKPDAELYRGITVEAPAHVLFRWLCQMRVAPYSYDWIDNCGHQSPIELTPGLDELELGQDVMGIFDLVDFQRDRHMTIRVKPRTRAAKLFGDIAGSYLIVPVVADGPRHACRLLVKLTATYPEGLWGRLLRIWLPWGDLIMMRRQLLNLKQLAERVGKPDP